MLRTQDHDFIIVFLRPWESICLQTLLPETKTTPIEIQNLDAVSPLAAEHKKIFARYVSHVRRMNYFAETVDAPAHIHRASVDKYAGER